MNNDCVIDRVFSVQISSSAISRHWCQIPDNEQIINYSNEEIVLENREIFMSIIRVYYNNIAYIFGIAIHYHNNEYCLWGVDSSLTEC